MPTSKPNDPDNKKALDIDKIPLDAAEPEVFNLITPSPTEKLHSHGNVDDYRETEEKPKYQRLSKIVRIFKGNTKAVVETKLAVDHARAAVGSTKAKGHLGVLPEKKNLVYAGPSEFKSRFNGKPGWVVITKSGNPTLIFTQDDPRHQQSAKKVESVFEVAIRDITRLKRATAFVNTAVEKVADFSTDKELLGSVEIDDQSGKTWRLTALPERDELFNRLVAIGGQRWENI